MRDIIELVQYPLGRINDSYAFCHHGGWYECDMQTHQLCTKSLLPNNSWAMYDMAECNFGNLGTNDFDNTRDCAKALGVDPVALWKCATSYEPDGGPAMLLASVTKANEAGVHAAPTVFLDGVQLDSAADLTVEAICNAYTGSTKPKACSQIPRLAQNSGIATFKTCSV
eukprot:INCI12210.1.p1 GENE.INCI12210.1~~INCI12210.1.p1  ORF type:complete len:169 (-),score=25.96 INCI12210.1:650-1156(-)